MFGISKICMKSSQIANLCSGAYTAMVMISLLGLPLELPQESPARAAGMSSFLDKLPQWLSRCIIASFLWIDHS